MTSLTASMPKITGRSKHAVQSPGSIAIRLGAFLMAIVAVSAFGPPLVGRLVHGPKASYTIVLKQDAPTAQAVAKLKDAGYDISSIDETAAGTAVVANIASRHTDDVLRNDSVAYVQANRGMHADHSLYESVQMKLGFAG